MSYRNSAKNRKIKRIFLQIFSILKFEWLNITTPLKIIVIWVLICFFWLFANWFDSYDGEISWNWFHKLLWITWYIIFILNLIILFFIFWQRLKENIKNLLHFNAKDSVIIIMLIIFWLLISINSIFIIWNIEIFMQWIILGKWLIYVVVWLLLWVIWWIFNLFSKTKTSIYIENPNYVDLNIEEQTIHDNKNNMKLPF